MFDGGLELSAQSLLENKGLVLVYFAVLILLVFLIVWYLRCQAETKTEKYYGYGMPDTYQVLASGPNVRFQELTGTNQGSTPINMATVKQMYPNIVKPQGERLTAMREAPVFYDISQTLGEYQYATQFDCADGQPPMPVKDSLGNMTYACADGSNPTKGKLEHAASSPATDVQEALLRAQLGY